MKKILVPVVLVVVSFLLVSCGGGNAPSTDLQVTLTEFQFNPNEFTVPAGKEITLSATNNGAVEHEFVIFNLGQTAGDKFGDEDEGNIYWEVEVLPGESKTVTFTAPSEPGEYYVTCGIEGHLESGMTGKLIVVAAE